ncbi:MAG: hypothetical protein AB3N07_06155 [Ruegeria sp.]
MIVTVTDNPLARSLIGPILGCMTQDNFTRTLTRRDGSSLFSVTPIACSRLGSRKRSVNRIFVGRVVRPTRRVTNGH